jgi:hypothetical protein
LKFARLRWPALVFPEIRKSGLDHHDSAYHWAERRKLETTAGAEQLAEIRA